ncbi:hypothetical protein J4Q44_G00141690 [Coregonus suidteri]|uniref:WWE domain-containing protein n=1 Tax=Coregonus suidteri TaxID=861788 RepID=A0AAN8LM95_9TELE
MLPWVYGDSRSYLRVKVKTSGGISKTIGYGREYGSLGPGQGSSSVSSGNVEQQYILRPQGTFQFTVGSTSYTLDFTAMTQTNSATRVQRNVRRRPKVQLHRLRECQCIHCPISPHCNCLTTSLCWLHLGIHGCGGGVDRIPDSKLLTGQCWD